MSYARARLWLGISGVGMLVLLCLIALVFRAPMRLLHTGDQPLWRDGGELAAVLFVYAAVQGAFDFFGGHILPTEYGRSAARFGTFFRGWLRGVVAHSTILLLIGLCVIGATRAGGFWGATGAFLAISVFLIAAQMLLAELIGGFGYRVSDDTVSSEPVPVVLASSGGAYFTGGIAGLPGRERIVVPARWKDTLPEQEWGVLLRRRYAAMATNTRTYGLALALGFNLTGFTFAYALAGGAGSVAGMVTTSLWFTLWSFLGLLILPTPSQKGVFVADGFTLARGENPDALAAVIRKLDSEQDDEPVRPGGVERVFHPIPSVARRLARFADSSRPTSGAWHAARMAIYLSWAGMSFLSRAVHCNAGRPDAWVFLPSD